MTDTASIPTTDTATVDVVPTTPEPVTAAIAVVGYPSVLPIAERRADIAFRVATITLVLAAVGCSVTVVWAYMAGAL